SEKTHNRIFTGASPADIETQTLQEREEAEAQHPLHDVVKMWQAPFDGRIKIDAPVRLIPVSDEERDDAPIDGVQVSVQVRSEPKWKARIPAGDSRLYGPSDLTDVQVRRGDRVYFRVGSVDNGSFDKVDWNPVIEYISDTTSLADIRDANGLPIYRFEAASDFILSGVQYVEAPASGEIEVKGHFFKPATTDSVFVVAIRNATDTVFNRPFGPYDIVDEEL